MTGSISSELRRRQDRNRGGGGGGALTITRGTEGGREEGDRCHKSAGAGTWLPGVSLSWSESEAH